MYILETERLKLREITINDAENAYLLNLDNDVIKYTGDKPFTSVPEAKMFLASYDHYKKYGFGRWAVVEKADPEIFLGWCGLKYVAEDYQYDIGFRFFKSKWNNGYATEAAKACLEYGFSKLQLTEIVGRVMEENKASIRVLEKIGLNYHESFDFCEGHAGWLYKITKVPTEKSALL